MDITIHLDDKSVNEAFRKAVASYGFKLKERRVASDEAFLAELRSDIQNYIDVQLTDFFKDGINCDVYSEFYDHNDEGVLDD